MNTSKFAKKFKYNATKNNRVDSKKSKYHTNVYGRKNKYFKESCLKNIKELIEENIIERCSSARKGYWKIKEYHLIAKI